MIDDFYKSLWFNIFLKHNFVVFVNKYWNFAIVYI